MLHFVDIPASTIIAGAGCLAVAAGYKLKNKARVKIAELVQTRAYFRSWDTEDRIKNRTDMAIAESDDPVYDGYYRPQHTRALTAAEQQVWAEPSDDGIAAAKARRDAMYDSITGEFPAIEPATAPMKAIAAGPYHAEPGEYMQAIPVLDSPREVHHPSPHDNVPAKRVPMDTDTFIADLKRRARDHRIALVGEAKVIEQEMLGLA